MKSAATIASPRLLGSKTKEEINLLGPRKKTQSSTDHMADFLVETFQAPEYRPAFCKIAWRLDEGSIHRMIASARELGKNPRAYFMTCAKNEMRRRGLA